MTAGAAVVEAEAVVVLRFGGTETSETPGPFAAAGAAAAPPPVAAGHMVTMTV